MYAIIHKTYSSVYLLLDDEAKKNTSEEETVQFFSNVDREHGVTKSATLNGFTVSRYDTVDLIKFSGVLKRETTDDKIEILINKLNSNKLRSINI